MVLRKTRNFRSNRTEELCNTKGPFVQEPCGACPPFLTLSMSLIFCWAPRVCEVKGLMNTKTRISKHEYRNKIKSRMTKIPNDGVVRKWFRSFENSDLGIVSDFGFRISNLNNALTAQNKTPPCLANQLWVKISSWPGVYSPDGRAIGGMNSLRHRKGFYGIIPS